MENLGPMGLPASLYGTAAVAFVSLGIWAGLRRRWGRAAGWTALALAGQACALELIWAGPEIRLQMFRGWSELLRTWRVVFLLAALAQAIVVGWGAWLERHALAAYARRLASIPQLLVLLLLVMYSATTIAPQFAQALAFGSSNEFANKLTMHATKVALGLLLYATALVNLALAIIALPAAELERLRACCSEEARWVRLDRRWIPWAAALWVVGASSLLAWLVLERIPHVPDEVVYLFQAKYFAEGRLWLEPPVDADALFVPFTLVENGKWYAATMPGWPALLALGCLVGAPWLVNPLLGGATILLAYALFRRVFDRDVADAATLLLAASPWLLFMSASLMPHPATLAWSAAALLAIARAREGGGAAWGALAGLSLGMLLHIRSLDAVVVAAAAGVWWLSAGWRSLRPAALAAAAGAGGIIAALLLAYNGALTGNPLVLPISRYTDQTTYPGSNRLGFGPDIGNFGWTGLDALPGHGPLDVFMNTNQNLYLVNFEMQGWGCGSLLVVFLMLAWRLEPRRGSAASSQRSGLLQAIGTGDALMWLLAAAVVAGLSLYWFSGGPDFGARYWYVILLPLVALTARGAQQAAARLRREGGIAPDAPARVAAFVALATLLGLFTLVPWRSLDKYYHYRGTRAEIRALEQQHRIGRSLVLLSSRGWWPDYASAIPSNAPLYGRDAPGPIYARKLTPEKTTRLRAFYSDRPVWVLEGPSVSGSRFRVVESPPAPTK